jgi:hypothetical protein
MDGQFTILFAQDVPTACEDVKITFFNNYYKQKKNGEKSFYISKIPYECTYSESLATYWVTNNHGLIEHSEGVKLINDLILVPDEKDHADQIYIEFDRSLDGTTILELELRSQEKLVMRSPQFIIG